MRRMPPRLVALWHASPPLTATGLVLLAAFAAALAGLAVDPRTIGGAPVWLKPSKFAISTAIYVFTFAAILTQLEGWRLARITGWTTAAASLLEVILISLQAYRGTTSHFNRATPLDAAVYYTMALGILLVLIMAVVLAVALFRHRFAETGMGWALRGGMVLTILGASTGGLMTRPTAAQMDHVRATGEMPIAGAHTVGAPDGTPGLPGTGWSRDHGDLRVPHFIGLHAVQVLPLMALALQRVRGRSRRLRLVGAGLASYAWLFAVLLWQALRGDPLLSLDGMTGAALAAWFAAAAGALLWATRRPTGGAARRPGSFTPRARFEDVLLLRPQTEPSHSGRRY